MKNSILKFVVLTLFLGMSLSSCESDDDEVYYYYYPESAYGIIGNASPNSGDLYFLADDNSINSSGLNYTDVFGYYNFYTGERILYLQDESGMVLDSASIFLDAGQYFSAFAVNDFSNVELVIFNDELEAPGAYRSSFRFINLSPDAQQIDIQVESDVSVNYLPFKEATPFMELEDGLYNMTFFNSSTGEVLLQVYDVELYPGRIYTIYTKGYINPPTGSNDTFSIEKIRNF